MTCNTTRRIRHRHTHTHTRTTLNTAYQGDESMSHPPTHTHTYTIKCLIFLFSTSFISLFVPCEIPSSVCVAAFPPRRWRRLHHSGARLCIRVNISTNLYKYISRRFNYLGTVVLSVWSVRFLNPHEERCVHEDLI